MARTKESVLERFAAQAIAGGATGLEVEYKDGYEEIFPYSSDFGVSIGTRIRSSSVEAKSLRTDLYGIHKRPRQITIGGRTYELRCKIHDSFGEDAFKVKFKPV